MGTDKSIEKEEKIIITVIRNSRCRFSFLVVWSKWFSLPFFFFFVDGLWGTIPYRYFSCFFFVLFSIVNKNWKTLWLYISVFYFEIMWFSSETFLRINIATWTATQNLRKKNYYSLREKKRSNNLKIAAITRGRVLSCFMFVCACAQVCAKFSHCTTASLRLNVKSTISSMFAIWSAILINYRK